jgi:hypothetical protein
MVSKKAKWAVVEAAAGMLGAALAEKAVESGWKAASGKKPPQTPGVRGVRWRQALAWAAATGMVLAVGRLLATGAASAGWRKATGRKPPR